MPSAIRADLQPRSWYSLDHLFRLLGTAEIIDNHPKPPPRKEYRGGRPNSPAVSGDQRNTTHRCYVRLGPRDNEIGERTPSGGMVLTPRQWLVTASHKWDAQIERADLETLNHSWLSTSGSVLAQPDSNG
jgi:hypothetical protein